jgi:hypothetical protein
MNRVYVLWHKKDFEEESTILNIFKTKKGAEDYRDELIREMYHEIEESDRIEYFIETFHLCE